MIWYISKPFLRCFEGYKYHEIAEELNIPIGAVKTRIHMARQVLKGQLKFSDFLIFRIRSWLTCLLVESVNLSGGDGGDHFKTNGICSLFSLFSCRLLID